ncbi:MAG: hypothetical protein QOD89_910 [Bradyrhizobium sp.]|jgi:hypothetical protein|nr:hypothetical protein [Bradyrhizobium sp.]
MKKTIVSNGVLTMIFWRKMQTYTECPAAIPIAIVPVGRSGWKALTSPKIARSYPRCARRVEKAQKQLQQIYALARD